MTKVIEPTEWQQGTLLWRDRANIFSGGPRGNGKSTCLVMDCIDHGRMYPGASALITRESYAGLSDLMQVAMQLALQTYSTGVSLNKQAGTLTMPNGSTIDFSDISDTQSWAKHQGKSRQFLGLDEFGNYLPTANQFCNMLRSNLRGPEGMGIRQHITANPAGRNHHYCVKHFVNRSPVNVPYLEIPDDPTSDLWVNVTAPDCTVNPHVGKNYQSKIKAATQGNDQRQQAWLYGSWALSGQGMMFADVFDVTIHVKHSEPVRMRFIVGADWGTSSPSVAILIGEVLDWGRGVTPGDLFVLDFVSTHIDDEYSQGSGATPPEFAAMIEGMLQKNRVKLSTEVICDDARGLVNDTVVDLMRKAGLNVSKPLKKNRTMNWQNIRTRLRNAQLGERHALYIDPRVYPLIELIQMAPRDDKNPEDLLRSWASDHFLDALAYGIAEVGPRSSQSKVIGMW